MQRPNEIIWFERIYLGTLALGIIQSWIAWPEMMKLGGPAFVLTTQLLTLALIGGLVLFVSRRRSNFAKWILVALFVVGLPILAQQVLEGQLPGSVAISLIQSVGSLVALTLLFTPNSRNWLKRKTVADT